MSEEEPSGGDLLGVRPIAKSFEKAADFAFGVLEKICMPVAEEYGLKWRDKVAIRRLENLATMMKALENKLASNNIPGEMHAHPRIVHEVVEKASWIEDLEVQDMWAGLLASSCTELGDDDSNLIFVNLLGQMTKLQARLLKYVCETAEKVCGTSGLISADPIKTTAEEIQRISGETDIHRLDRELDHLHGLSLLVGGLNFYDLRWAELAPTALALHLYVRCTGSRVSPTEFFHLTPPKPGGPVPAR